MSENSKRPGTAAFALIVALSSALYITKPISDPDLGWHVVIGRWILSHRTFPTTEHWNMFALGKPWIAYSWSTEILFAALDRLLGFHGLLLLQIGIGTLFALTLTYCLVKMARSFGVGLLLALYVTLACFNHFTLRPQLLTWIYFLALTFTAWRIDEEGVSTGKIAALIVIMIAWANTHITTIFGVVTVFLWLLSDRQMKRAATLTLISFIATLITPYFGQEWLTLFSKTSHPFSHQGISEFNASSILQTTPGLLLLELALLLFFMHKRKKAVDPGKLLLSFGFILAGAALVKFLPFSLISVTLLLALIWGSEEDPKVFGNLGEAVSRLGAFVEHRSLLIAIAMLTFAGGKFYLLWKSPVDRSRSAAAAFEFAEANKLPEPLLVPFDFGGHLMYRISDTKGVLRYPVPIDGRTNVVPPDVWQEFIDAYRGKSGWNRYLQRVNPGAVIWRTDSPFVSLLLAGGQWCEVHRSGTGINESSVLIKREEGPCPPL